MGRISVSSSWIEVGMRKRLIPLTLTVLAVLAMPRISASQATEGTTIGGFQTSGAVTAGYRFTDVAGRRQKYNELFNLRTGFRLHDINMTGTAIDAQRFADIFSFAASGIGGDPFEAGQVRLSKTHLYDFRANYRQTYYNWDRNDEQSHPAGLAGLTSNHNFSTVRKFGSANFTAYPTNDLRFNFEYYRTGRDGTTLTTRTLEYIGAPAFWAGFLRANPYVIEAPVNEIANRFSGGVNYSWRDWNFAYKAGYQTYEETLTLDNIAPGQRSINTNDPATANERLDRASWLEFRNLTTPISEFSYNGRAGSRVQIRGGYIFFKYSGPASLNASFNGIARSNTGGTAFAPYAVSVVNRAELTEPNHVIDQGFTIELSPSWNFHADYRYSRFDIDSEATFRSVSSGTPAEGETTFDWSYGLHILDAALEYAPERQFMVRPGIRLMKRDVTVIEDGVAEPLASLRSNFVWPVVSVYYSPSNVFTIRGDLQSITNGAPYTRISPRTNVSSRIIARVQPTNRLSIENNFAIRNANFAATDFRNTMRSNATAVTYTLTDKLALLGGFTYDSFLATASVTFLRGVAPLQAIWRDQTINRVWQGGIDARPFPNLSIQFSGNYVRTTGVGEISGEPPTFGPLRWPMATGTISYNFPKAGRLSLDLQRTYYIEEILRGDNFSANLLGIRWTTEF
jgi:hypothetical protein